jgi:hypothetical protein
MASTIAHVAELQVHLIQSLLHVLQVGRRHRYQTVAVTEERPHRTPACSGRNGGVPEDAPLGSAYLPARMGALILLQRSVPCLISPAHRGLVC